MIIGTLVNGIARRNGDVAEVLELPHRDLGEALADGVTLEELSNASVREQIPLADAELRAPIPHPRDVWAVGVAYQAHRDEVDAGEPDPYPSAFIKAPSSINAPGAPIVLPRLAPEKVDYEGEIAVVIGAPAHDVDAADGWSRVFGITAANDVSARDVQHGRFNGGVADLKAKSFHTFTPLGPWVVTPDEFADRNDIGLRTLIDGEVRQQARTSELIYPIPRIVSYISCFASLRPGDVVLTGTPAGVGQTDGRFLRPGQQVRIEVDLVGALENPVIANGAGVT